MCLKPLTNALLGIEKKEAIQDGNDFCKIVPSITSRPSSLPHLIIDSLTLIGVQQEIEGEAVKKTILCFREAEKFIDQEVQDSDLRYAVDHRAWSCVVLEKEEAAKKSVDGEGSQDETLLELEGIGALSLRMKECLDHHSFFLMVERLPTHFAT
ncbi:hypothetical protein Tcan_16405 [Toxocara canis]|uniref:Uncharacterized protein n=1 Tax=Toxocara canis TaxID=6265 RepID=A0A0B2V250_TOXCA|nr:hypothetical protein Tcan_16405 [Toxocara canis]